MTTSDSAPQWASGCGECSYGLVNPPPLEGRTPVWQARLSDFQQGLLEFCPNCKAGTVYLVHLEQLREKLLKEAKEDYRMAEHAKQGSHPEMARANERHMRIYREND